MARVRKRVAVVFGIVLGAAVLSGCSQVGDLLGGDAPVRDGDSDEITEGGDLDVFTLKVGDCYDNTAEETVTELPVVPCAQAHDNEVFYEFRLPDGDFPGDDAIEKAYADKCGTEFETFIGVAYDDSKLDFGAVTPTAESWSQNDDRLVQCVAWDPAGKVTGSLKSTAR